MCKAYFITNSPTPTPMPAGPPSAQRLRPPHPPLASFQFPTMPTPLLLPMPSTAPLRFAVVGAGAAGLAASRELRREGHTPVVFERAAAVGGTWLYTPPAPLGAAATHKNSGSSSLYASLRTNVPREAMGFLDFPFAAAGCRCQDPRRFPGHEEVLRYLEAFARRFDLLRLVRFETEVVRVRRGSDDGRWAVTSRKLGEKGSGAGEDDQEEFYDAVVVCNGHYTAPRIADILGNIYIATMLNSSITRPEHS